MDAIIDRISYDSKKIAIAYINQDGNRSSTCTVIFKHLAHAGLINGWRLLLMSSKFLHRGDADVVLNQMRSLTGGDFVCIADESEESVQLAPCNRYIANYINYQQMGLFQILLAETGSPFRFRCIQNFLKIYNLFEAYWTTTINGRVAPIW